MEKLLMLNNWKINIVKISIIQSAIYTLHEILIKIAKLLFREIESNN